MDAEATLKVIKHVDEQLAQHRAETKKDHAELMTMIDARFQSFEEMIRDAVPNGDFRGHREDHEKWLAERKVREEGNRELWMEVRKWATIGVLIIVGGGLIEWAKVTLGVGR